MKKKQIKAVALLALIFSAAALVLSGYLLATRAEDQTHLIDDLYRENQELRSQLDALSSRLDQFMTVTTLENWTLTADPWPDSTGADVTFTAVPSNYQTGVSATLLVLLGGQEVSSVPCHWDGEQFTATAGLNAADGYSYYCLLSAPGGEQELTIMTPDSPDAGIPVYLQSSLSSYCNLVVSDWGVQSSSIVLTDAYAQVQLPQLSASGNVAIDTSELVLRLNGQVSVKVPIRLTPSEVAGSFEATLSDLRLPMPELKKSESLELHLEVVLSDGRHLQAFGISWQLDGNKLTSTVG